jgi:CHAD domain-containing protein
VDAQPSALVTVRSDAVAAEDGTFELAYYDVPERRITRAGATLSRRLEQGKGIWQLEIERPDGSYTRFEQPGGPAAPPSRLARALPALLRTEEPARVLRLRVHLNGGGDEVEVLEGLHAAERLSLELEDVHGYVVETLAQPDGATKDAIGRLREMLARQYEEILRHDIGVRLDLDPESVHRLRVAARRARAVLRAARPVLDREWSEPLRAELKWLGGSLGPRRDLDVLLAHLRAEIADLEQPERTAAGALTDSLEQEHESAQALAVEALSSERYYRLLDELEAAARGPRVRQGEVALSKLAAQEFKRLRKRAERLGPDATDGELHKTRIRGKRARYAAELAGSELGKSGTKLVSRAKAFQDVLGAHQDAIVAEGRLRGLVADTPRAGAAFAAGRLVERQRLRRREARAKLSEAWRALDRSARAALG